MGTRILVAEDEERIASLLHKAFTKQGFDVEVAADGVVALELLLTHPFDLLVLDLGLPGADGEEVLRTLRRRGQTLPVLVLTARDGVGDKVAAFDAGADDYVTKPFSVHELLARVRARLRQAVPAGQPSAARVGSTTSVEDDTGRTRAGRVLIVEDEQRIAEFLVKGLESSGFETVVAEDGEVGLFLARSEPYDVIVLDVGLPGQSGLEVLRRLRAHRSGVPVIMLTGQDGRQVREGALRAGAATFLTKPFRIADVRAAIDQHLPASTEGKG